MSPRRQPKLIIWSNLRKLLNVDMLVFSIRDFMAAVITYGLLALFKVIGLQISEYIGENWSWQVFDGLHTIFTVVIFVLSFLRDIKKLMGRKKKNDTRRRKKKK